jgi:hypothetical protein
VKDPAEYWKGECLKMSSVRKGMMLWGFRISICKEWNDVVGHDSNGDIVGCCCT